MSNDNTDKRNAAECRRLKIAFYAQLFIVVLSGCGLAFHEGIAYMLNAPVSLMKIAFTMTTFLSALGLAQWFVQSYVPAMRDLGGMSQ